MRSILNLQYCVSDWGNWYISVEFESVPSEWNIRARCRRDLWSSPVYVIAAEVTMEVALRNQAEISCKRWMDSSEIESHSKIFEASSVFEPSCETVSEVKENRHYQKYKAPSFSASLYSKSDGIGEKDWLRISSRYFSSAFSPLESRVLWNVLFKTTYHLTSLVYSKCSVLFWLK